MSRNVVEITNHKELIRRLEAQYDDSLSREAAKEIDRLGSVIVRAYLALTALPRSDRTAVEILRSEIKRFDNE